jgi:DNA-binding protein HU-beta
MNKEDLIKNVSDDIGVVQTETAIIVDAVLKAIYKGILENEKVTFKNFGAFHQIKRKARDANSPRTGEAVRVPAKTVISFKMSQKMKHDLNK